MLPAALTGATAAVTAAADRTGGATAPPARKLRLLNWFSGMSVSHPFY